MSSAAAAVIVHEIWRAGAILGAAVTPVLMALFAEALRRPAERVTVRTWRTPARRASLSHPSVPHETIRIYRSRPRWRLAVLTGLAACALGVAGLTISEALLQRSVADRDAGTTLFDTRPPDRTAPATEPERGAEPAESAPERARDERQRLQERDGRSGTGSSNRPEERSPTPTPTPTPSATQPPAEPEPTPVSPQPTPPGPAQTGSEPAAPA